MNTDLPTANPVRVSTRSLIFVIITNSKTLRGCRCKFDVAQSSFCSCDLIDPPTGRSLKALS